MLSTSLSILLTLSSLSEHGFGFVASHKPQISFLYVFIFQTTYYWGVKFLFCVSIVLRQSGRLQRFLIVYHLSTVFRHRLNAH